MDDGRARELLEKRRDDLDAIVRAATQQGSLDQAQSDSTGDSASDQHPGDLATDTLERELDLSVRENAEAELRDVDRAIERLAKGLYGICPVCDEPIPDERLEARPEAEFCITHQPATAPLPAD
jgi:RNA polymerase-binding transcription factor DksA